jgi:DNA-binding CsgD family transcriptional regulator
MPSSKQRLAYERGRDDLIRLTHRGLARTEFVARAAELLGEAVPVDGACWHTVDPATRLITSHYTNLSGEGFRYICHNEYLQDDVGKFASLVGRRRPATTLSAETGQQLERSARYREIYRPRGWGSELRASFDLAGTSWGSVMMLRASDRPEFSGAEAALVGSLSRHVAHGLRTAILRGAPPSARVADEPGLVVLDGHEELEAVSPAAERWLEEIDDVPGLGALPAAVLSVAARARAVVEGTAVGDGPARVRLQTRSGRWLILHGSGLGDGRAAIIVEPARSVEIAPLVIEAYGLTAREREVLAAVVRGEPTDRIAAALFLSPHTVQDHLKSIFEKTSTRSRRELTGRVFYDLAAPSVFGGAPLAADGWFAEPPAER